MYDTIVIGNDLSSLIAATILSHNGIKTILISEGNIQHTYAESGYTFNVDPSPLAGFGPAQICSRLSRDLGISVAEDAGLCLLDPGLQIIMPDHRIDLFCDQEALIREMEREFAAQGGDIRRLFTPVLKISELIGQWISEKPFIFPKSYKELVMLFKNIPTLMGERLSLSTAFNRIKSNPSLKRVFEAESALLSNSHTDSNIGRPSILSAYTLSLPLRGLYYSKGGNDFFIQSIKSRFEDSGGQHAKNYSVIRIGADKEIDVDIQTPDTQLNIKGRYLIVSTKWEKIKFLLLNDHKFRRLERRLRSIKSTYYPFTLHVGVLDGCIPENTATYVVVIVDPNRTILENNFIFLEISDTGNAKRAPNGKRALSATVFLKESPQVINDDGLKDISKAVFQSLETFLPFLQENLDFLNIDKSIELSRNNQEVVNQKYSMRSCPFFGLSSISSKTHMGNVYVTGGMLLAGLGFEGEIISGINAANSVIAREGKKHG